MERLDLAQAAITAFALFSDSVYRQKQENPVLILFADGSGRITEWGMGELSHDYLEFSDLADLLHQVRKRI